MKRESLYLQGGLALNSWYAETEATRNGREQRPSPREAQTNTRDACATRREMYCHPRFVRFARCVLRKWRRYCPGAIFNARWNTVRIEFTFPNPHSPAIVSMLF